MIQSRRGSHEEVTGTEGLQRSLLCMVDRWEQNGDCRCNRLQNGRKH